MTTTGPGLSVKLQSCSLSPGVYTGGAASCIGLVPGSGKSVPLRDGGGGPAGLM